jgi:hypothetical protein
VWLAIPGSGEALQELDIESSIEQLRRRNMIRTLLTRTVLVGTLLAATFGSVSANVLANPGFEAGVGPFYGAPSWITFGNGFTEPADGGCIAPYAGNQLMKMFGTFNPFGVSGIFQEFPTTPGTEWALSSRSRHCSADPMIGYHVNGGNGNWVVQKIAFFDAGNNEIGAAESIILDGTFATDTWFDNAPAIGIAPAGTVKLQAFILYLQPGFDGGAAQIDDVVLEDITAVPVQPTTWGRIKTLF